MKKTKLIDYTTRIKRAKDRFEAADLVRARTCQVAAIFTEFTANQRIAMIEDGEQQAKLLERDLAEGVNHPWKQWLKDWGYC